MDLAVGIAIIVLLSLAIFAIVRHWAHRAPPRQADTLAAAALLAIGIYAVWGRDSVLLARLLPFSNLVVLSNLFPPLAAIIAAVMWEKKQTPTWRRIAYELGIGGVAVWSIAAPFAGPVPQCQNLWRNGVCLQTTEASCSAACGATVLAAHHIETTEQEMARLCLTRKGTLWQGLYRGLKLKTAGTPYQVEVFRGSVDDLRTKMPGPVILTVGIPTGVAVDPIYTERYRWTPGKLHSVVMYDFAPNDRVEMGDPSIETGREQWTLDDLRTLYRGQGLRLVNDRARQP